MAFLECNKKTAVPGIEGQQGLTTIKQAQPHNGAESQGNDFLMKLISLVHQRRAPAHKSFIEKNVNIIVNQASFHVTKEFSLR